MEINTAEDINTALSELDDVSQFNKQLAFKCVQKALALKDIDLEFEARLQFLRQLVFLSEYEEAIAIFPWFLNSCDKHPDRFSYFNVLWTFKWIMGAITNYHTISLDHLDRLFKEFEKRYTAYGSGEKVILYYKMRQLAETGNISESLEYYAKYIASTESGALDDCLACQPNNCMEVFLAARQYDKVIDLANMIIRKKLSCHIVPHTSYPSALEATFLLEHWSDAEMYFQLSCKKLKVSESHLRAFSSIVIYCSLKGYHVKGRNIIEKQLPFALDTKSDYYRFFFFMACSLFFQSMENRTNVKLKLKPGAFLDFTLADDNEYSVDALVNWFRDKSVLHGELLDNRNQNNFYREHFAHMTNFVEEKRKK